MEKLNRIGFLQDSLDDISHESDTAFNPLRILQGNSMSESDEALCRSASTVTWVTPDDPPALILHGTKDTLVPVKQSRILHNSLTAARVPSQLIVIEGAPHSFHLQPKQRDLRPDVIEFFDRHLKPAQ